MDVQQKFLRLGAIAAASILVLSGCGVGAEEAPGESASPDPAQTEPVQLPDADLERYAAALLTDVELVGQPSEPPVEGFADEPMTMYLTLSDFEPTGRCAELLEELNAFTAPTVGGVAAKFTRPLPADQIADDVDGEVQDAGVETLIFETVDYIEPMSIYREIPIACGTLTSSQVTGAEATFTKVPGLDALHLEISDGEAVESLAVGGSSVNAKYHVYMTAEQVSLEQAQEIFAAQAEKLRDTFQDDVSSGSASNTPEPSTTTSS